ncbi:uncharacterized protein LOC120068020 isoform X2 [Benincasa hispida]|uniref:uncharacterized protein LOC120068020 isoform X2 n=1 Tax=Benincasa hispida TaxID=102211 RepID=UPI001900DE96|nr:uncharacterized protein LOC120068020 isoform X2 [Benincasa hispida]
MKPTKQQQQQTNQQYAAAAASTNFTFDLSNVNFSSFDTPNPLANFTAHTHDLEAPPHSNNSTDNFVQPRKQRIENLEQRINLYRTALEGDWKNAQSILVNNKSLLTASITRDKETALHIAAGAKHSGFVEELVKQMSKEEVALKNRHGNTALCFAAASGVVKIAEVMVNKNKHLPLIRGFGDVTPLFMAVSYKCKPMASYLFSVTQLIELTSEEQIELLIATIHSDYFDISLKILELNPSLATMKDTKNNNETALHVMARKPSAIDSGDRLNFWKNCITFVQGISNKEEEMKTVARQLVESLWKHAVFEFPQKELLSFIRHPSRLLHDAASVGNVEFLVLLIRRYPDIVWEEDADGKSIFHVAVENRLEDVFNLIYEIGGLKDFSAKYRTTVKGKYNILHLAAKLAAPNHLDRVSGAALQMQRELLWFKEVEKIVLSSQLEAKCEDPLKLTPRELFTKEHKDLRKDGEAWMRNTANSCMLVSTLIATVIFAAAFTVPGGDNSEGTPIFQKRFWFTVFVISDAVALISASSSILVFLSILTSRYSEDDFLHSLPFRLLIGLTSLFISIVCMVVAFSATFFMHYHNNTNTSRQRKLSSSSPLTVFFSSSTTDSSPLPLPNSIICSTPHSARDSASCSQDFSQFTIDWLPTNTINDSN